MPMIYKYKCVPSISFDRNSKKGLVKIHSKSCDFSIEDNGPHVYLKLNGKEVVLNQHDFVKNAESLTKDPFEKLVKNNRIIYKKDKVCLDCFKFKEECKCKNKNLILIRKLKGIKCPKCGKGKIDQIYVKIS